MNITLLELYHPMLKMGITLKRTPNKDYLYYRQIASRRDIWSGKVVSDLEEIKGELMGELINGYEITQNLMGIDFIDSVLAPIHAADEEEKKRLALSAEETVSV